MATLWWNGQLRSKEIKRLRKAVDRALQRGDTTLISKHRIKLRLKKVVPDGT